MSDLRFTLDMSWKNLRRRSRRTLLLILGLAISNAVIIWIPTFRMNANRSMMKNVLEFNTGREVFARPGHFDFENNLISSYLSFDRKLWESQVPSHVPYTLRAHAPVMAASEENAAPVLLKGMEFEREANWNSLGKLIHKKTFSTSFPLILGEKLANTLGVKQGDELAVIGQAIDGSTANELFTVEEILQLGGGSMEGALALTTLSALQNFMLLPEGHVHMATSFSNEDLPIEVAGVERINWEKFLPEVASGANFMDSFIKFYVVFFILISALAMANTLSLTFLERKSEYKMLTFIGAPAEWLKKSILIEIAVIALSAMIAGNLITLIAVTVIQFYPLDLTILTGGVPLQIGGVVLSQKIDMLLRPSIFLWCNFLFLITLALASLYPARVVLKDAQKGP